MDGTNATADASRQLRITPLCNSMVDVLCRGVEGWVAVGESQGKIHT